MVNIPGITMDPLTVPPSLLEILKASARRSDRRLESKEKEVWTDRDPSGGRMVSNKSIEKLKLKVE